MLVFFFLNFHIDIFTQLQCQCLNITCLIKIYILTVWHLCILYLLKKACDVDVFLSAYEIFSVELEKPFQRYLPYWKKHIAYILYINVTEFIKLLPSPALAKTSGVQTVLRPADPSFINDTIQLLTHQSTSKRENRWNYLSYFTILYNYFVCKTVSPIVTDVYCSMLRSNLSPKLPTYECCIWYLLYESCYSEAVKPQL